MLMRGKLLGGALFAGVLFGATVPNDVASTGGYSGGTHIGYLQARPVLKRTQQIAELIDEDDIMLQLIIAAVTQEMI